MATTAGAGPAARSAAGEPAEGRGARGRSEPRLPRRDLTHVRPLLPVISRLVRWWFRPEVRGLERIPDGPVLFVGNHSGGPGSPDSVVFILAFLERFGVDRPLYWLAHELLMAVPGLGRQLKRVGLVAASPEAARAALRRGASVIVYPGGEVELNRPWSARHEIRFLGRTGFLRLARETGVPLVPVVAAGGHNTFLPVTDGRWLARALGLDRRLKLKTLPVAVALPWGLNVGGVVPNLPLPVRILVEVCEPIDVAARFGNDLDAAYRGVTSLMQTTLDRLAAERRRRPVT